MLFLIACSSIALDDSAPTTDDGADVAAANADALKYAACYATCETIWTPAPACNEFYAKQSESERVTVEECQAECHRAIWDGDQNGIPWYDEWPENFDWLKAYGCEYATDTIGPTPCDSSGRCVEE